MKSFGVSLGVPVEILSRLLVVIILYHSGVNLLKLMSGSVFNSSKSLKLLGVINVLSDEEAILHLICALGSRIA